MQTSFSLLFLRLLPLPSLNPYKPSLPSSSVPVILLLFLHLLLFMFFSSFSSLQNLSPLNLLSYRSFILLSLVCPASRFIYLLYCLLYSFQVFLNPCLIFFLVTTFLTLIFQIPCSLFLFCSSLSPSLSASPSRQRLHPFHAFYCSFNPPFHSLPVFFWFLFVLYVYLIQSYLRHNISSHFSSIRITYL